MMEECSSQNSEQHQCRFCNFKSRRKYNVKIHEGRKHNQDYQQHGSETRSNCVKEETITLQNDYSSLLREYQKLKQEYSSLENNFMQLFGKTKHILQDVCGETPIKSLTKVSKSSERVSDKFDRFYKAVHGRTPQYKSFSKQLE